MIGQRIGRYEIIAKLGEGGMGVVWKARDPLLDREVALKLLPEVMAQSQEARRRFLREAKAASGLHHPGIAAVFDAGDDGGHLYLAIQFVPGQTMTTRLQQGTLGVTEALRVARETAIALTHAHGKGVLHRDVTTNNIMVDEDGHVTLVDFGLALVEDHTRLTMSRASLGTAGFMAPEMILGEEATPATDVYSLGVVLYDMLTGVLPFHSSKIEEQLRATVSDAPRPPSDRLAGIPPAVDALVLQMLAKSPADRPAGAVLVSRLQNLLDGATGETITDASTTAVLTAPLPPAPSPPVVSAPPSSRRRRNRLLATFALVTVVVVAGWSLRIVLDSPSPTVAVLPFQLGADVDQSRWLQEVIGAELTSRLSRLSDLRVVPWRQSRQHDDLGQWERTADQLEVDALVGGRCEVSGRMVRGAAYVIDPRSSFQTWAYTLPERLDDVSAGLDSMALGIAHQLLGDLKEVVRAELVTESPIPIEALRWYGQGLVAEVEGTDDQALQWFERSSRRDTTFVAPVVGVARVHLRVYLEDPRDQRALARAESTFSRAARLDPKNIEVREGLAEITRRRTQP